MHQLQKYYGQITSFLMILIMVSACASLQLKTPEEKLFTIKSTYLGFVSTAVLYKQEGRLSSSQEETLTTLFKQADTLLFALDSYVRFKNEEAFNSNLARLLPIMNTLREALLATEQKGST